MIDINQVGNYLKFIVRPPPPLVTAGRFLKDNHEQLLNEIRASGKISDEIDYKMFISCWAYYSGKNNPNNESTCVPTCTSGYCVRSFVPTSLKDVSEEVINNLINRHYEKRDGEGSNWSFLHSSDITITFIQMRGPIVSSTNPNKRKKTPESILNYVPYKPGKRGTRQVININPEFNPLYDEDLNGATERTRCVAYSIKAFSYITSLESEAEKKGCLGIEV